MGFVLGGYFFQFLQKYCKQNFTICGNMERKLDYIYHLKILNNNLKEIAKKNNFMICENLERQTELYL
jgi:hypothetical protein